MWWDDCEGYSFLLIRQAGTAMNNLAVAYYNLGRHADAVAMMERVLEFQRRVLPVNHPEIGEVGVDRVVFHSV
jgi:hypothetical protein